MRVFEPFPRAAILCPPALAQSRLYARVLRAMGREFLELELGESGLAQITLRGAGPLGRVALMTDGPLWRQNTTTTERHDGLARLPRLLRAHRIAALVINCSTPLEARILHRTGHVPILTGGYSARLDLAASQTIRRARLKSKWRNRLVRAETSGLHVERARFSPRRHGWLLNAEAAQRKARGYRGLPLEFTRLAADVSPETAQVFTASQKGVRLGAMLFLLHDGAASYHIGHLSAEGRALAAHNLLLWQAANWLAANGVAWLDLGPVETEHAPGLARFKLGCGAAPIKRGATCLYTRATAPVGRLATQISRLTVRGFAGQIDRSCR